MTVEASLGRRDFLKTFGATIIGSIIPSHMLDLVQANPEAMERIASIENGASALIELIREVSRSQAKEWQKVPALALEADGRHGYSEHYRLAYTRRLWEIQRLHKEGRSGFCVDLETGEFVSLFSEDKNNRSVSNEHVLLLALDIDSIDATKINRGLKNLAKQDHFYTYVPATQNKWRNELRKKHGLQRPNLFF